MHKYAESLSQSHTGSLFMDSISESSYDPMLVDSVGFFCDVLYPSGSFNHSFLSSTEFPGLSLILSCRSLNLLLSFVGWRLSGDNWARHQSKCSKVSLGTITLTTFFFSIVWSYPRSHHHPTSDLLPSRQCHGWAHSHDIALRLGQSFFG